jgi:hypothetical protein
MKNKVFTLAFATVTCALLSPGAARAEEAPAPTAPAEAHSVLATAGSARLQDQLGLPTPVWLTSSCCLDYQNCLAACPPVGQHGHVACVGACNSAYQGCSC